MTYSVGELAKLTGVTVRALHHYDEIGLVRPSQRSAAGYRLYDRDDVLRLQHVLLLREVGLPLDDIAAVLDDPSFDRARALRDHREVLVELMRAGAAVDDARVREQVDAHRAHIDRWFYPCSHEMHRGLAALYVGDPRFAANLDKVAAGLARFLHDAIVAA